MSVNCISCLLVKSSSGQDTRPPVTYTPRCLNETKKNLVHQARGGQPVVGVVVVCPTALRRGALSVRYVASIAANWYAGTERGTM